MASLPMSAAFEARHAGVWLLEVSQVAFNRFGMCEAATLALSSSESEEDAEHVPRRYSRLALGGRLL